MHNFYSPIESVIWSLRFTSADSSPNKSMSSKQITILEAQLPTEVTKLPAPVLNVILPQ